MKNNSSCNYKTSIGGQALIEGILMRGPKKQAIVCRTADGLVEKIEDPWHIAHMVWLFLLGLHPAGSLIQLPVIRRRCFEKPAVPVAVAPVAVR